MKKIKAWLFFAIPLFIYLFTLTLTVPANDKEFPSGIPYTDIEPTIRQSLNSKKIKEIKRGKLKRIYFAGAILQVLLFLNILLLFYNVLTYQSSTQYRWQFIVNGIIVLLLVGYIALVINNKSYFKQMECGKRKIVLSTLFSFSSILFILYFQLYQFYGL